MRGDLLTLNAMRLDIEIITYGLGYIRLDGCSYLQVTYID
jgi:hypothetical protein